LERRIQEHNDGTEGAAYTKARRPVQLKWSKECVDRVHACREEYAIKQLRKSQKLILIGDAQKPEKVPRAKNSLSVKKKTQTKE
jgi:predicted GIY-YIG superfamily endonuclease